MSKFLPEPWTIFKANADKISLFPVAVPGALMAFYFRLWVVHRDIEKAREEAAAVANSGRDDDIGSGNVKLIASRLAATLQPGKAALDALASLVPHSAVIDANALSMLDPKKLRFDGTLREYVDATIKRADEVRASRAVRNRGGDALRSTWGRPAVSDRHIGASRRSAYWSQLRE